MNQKRLTDEELIKEIVTRYGEVIDLGKKPYLIVEILRTHGKGVADIPDGGVSVAGVGSPPGPSGGVNALGNVVDNAQLMKEILKISKLVHLLNERVDKLGRT
jgi:hypothetical protein